MTKGVRTAVAALQVAARDGIDGPVVTIGCDSWDRYRGQPWLAGLPAE